MPTRTALAGVTAWAAARTARTALAARPPGGAGLWERTNHAGETVTLLEGPAWVLGAAVGSLVAGDPAGAVVVSGVGGWGLLDDLRGDAGAKGLRGHLEELRHGRVTTGTAKILGIGVVALAVSAASTSRRVEWTSRILDTALGAGVIAGMANLHNLLDLRPGRALKVATLLAGPAALAGSGAGASVVGANAAVLGADLAGRSMLGDCGANAAGALVGHAIATRLGTRGRLAVLTILTALTLASERVSFTRVIEATPGLRGLDAWGRPRG